MAEIRSSGIGSNRAIRIGPSLIAQFANIIFGEATLEVVCSGLL